MVETIAYIIEQFGEPNEHIDENLLDDIIEEISTIEDTEMNNELVLVCIELGKPQVLEYIFSTSKFNKKDMVKFKKHVEEFVKHSEHDEKFEDILRKFEIIIKNYENPRKRKWG